MDNETNLKKAIHNSTFELYKEIEDLNFESEMLTKRKQEIDIRMHQIAGALETLEKLTAIADLDHQLNNSSNLPSDES